MFDVKITKEGNDKQTVIINGYLDSLTAPGFGEEMKGKLEGITLLTLDLTNLTYISSAGLRELLVLQNIMDEQGKMVLKNANAVILDVLEVSGFISFMTIESDRKGYDDYVE